MTWTTVIIWKNANEVEPPINASIIFFLNKKIHTGKYCSCSCFYSSDSTVSGYTQKALKTYTKDQLPEKEVTYWSENDL